MADLVCPCIMEDDEQTRESKRLDKLLKKDSAAYHRAVKILLLGSGDSGKSTFLKQMIIIHGRGEFTVDEQREYRHLIYSNIIDGMREILTACDKLQLPLEKVQSSALAKSLRSFQGSTSTLDTKTFLCLVEYVKELWTDGTVKFVYYDKRNYFQIMDSCRYFFEDLRRISQWDYVPTNRDILFSRKATRNILDYHFNIQRVPFRFIDVGGQRSQRQKWFQCFEDVTSIIFLASSSEYDQKLWEYRRRNRLEEAVDVFDTIVNHHLFKRVSIILFLNKTDILLEKLPRSNISDYFPSFSADSTNVNDVQKFLVSLFDGVRRDREKLFYYHFTTAVDTDNIRKIFDDVKDTILEKNIADAMLTPRR